MSETLVRMPKLADTLVEGTLGQWLKQVGDTVSPGEPLASIETDKVTTELSSPFAGTLLELLVAEGQTVPIETPIARIGTSSAPASPAPAANPATAPPTPVTPPPTSSAPPTPKPTPVAARLLVEHRLTADQIPSQSGRLTKEDVLLYLQRQDSIAGSSSRPPIDVEPSPSPGGVALETDGTGVGLPRSADGAATADEATGAEPPRSVEGAPAADAERQIQPPLTMRGAQAAPSSLGGVARPARVGVPRRSTSGGAPGGGGEVVPLSGMRRAIAAHMTLARQTIPHGQTVMAVDMSELVAWRELHKTDFRQREGANLTFTVLFACALARQLGPGVDLGVAVALDDGLIVPTLRNPAELALGEIARRIADIATRARAKTLSPGETQGAQMTLTNVGSFGNLTASPIIPMGQTGILAPGLVEQRPLPGPAHGVRLGWRCLLALMFDRRVLTDFAADRLLRGVVAELHHIPQTT